MKTNKGVLSMNEKYTFIQITDLGETSACCDNCGASIRYVVELLSSNGKKYHVGTECSKTLQEANISNVYSMNEQLKAFKKVSQAKNLIENGSKVRIAVYIDSCIVVGLNKNGTATKVIIEKCYDPFLATEIQCATDFIESVRPLKDNKFTCLGSPHWYFDHLKTGTRQYINMF